jgi:hypothetical protein
MDMIIEKNPGYDVHIKWNDGREEFIEIKGSYRGKYALSPLQFGLAKQIHAQQNNQVYRVIFFNASQVVYDSVNYVDDLFNDVLEWYPGAVSLKREKKGE